MVSRQTCEVRRRLPRGVHFCAAKRNCHASIIETRGVTNTCGHQEAPTVEVGAFACRHVDRPECLGGRGPRWPAHPPLDCRKSFSKSFADGCLPRLSRALPARTHVAHSGIWP
jgi:hypothetical protein